jgi:hypothetical protein
MDKIIRVMVDIKPPEDGDFKIELKDKTEIESPPKEIAREGLDNLIKDIIAEPVTYKESLEDILNGNHDPIAELAYIGASVKKFPEKLKKISEPENAFYEKIISQIHAPAKSVVINLTAVKTSPKLEQPKTFQPVLSNISQTKKQEALETLGRIIKEDVITDFYQNPPKSSEAKASNLKTQIPGQLTVNSSRPNFNFAPPEKKSYSKLIAVFLGAIGLLAYGATLKHELVRHGLDGLDNIKSAQADLENFNFSGAAENFKKSYESFSQASDNLNLAGAGLASMLGNIPGLSKISSAKDMAEAGKLLSNAGRAMSEALSLLSKTGAILDPNSSDKTKPSKILSQLRGALELSARNFDKAKALIAGIDENIIPEDKRQEFYDFRDKMPLFENLLADSKEYIEFLEGIVGIDRPRKYLVLFQNNSELRPTGGFPGTYGVVSFSNGGLSDFFVNDVYNLDGQIKENIIPPKQLQHITPTLGMRDSAWFIDFPASARKVMEFFAKESGYEVNGVITLNPDIISGILKVIGPIKMPEYDTTLTADNFLSTIQEEVEYGPNRTQPKQIVVDLAPKLLEKLYSADAEKWAKIFDVFMAGLDEKDILFYFDDKYLEGFALEKGFAGEVKKQPGDYMAINFSNIKGSKTDVVTDSSISIDSRIEGNKIINKVAITRIHNGGDYEHGFYNKQNPAYVRVLLADDANIISMKGNDLPNFRPIMNYSISAFNKDADMARFESGFNFDPSLKIDRFEEAGRQGIGFWMIVDPGETKKIEFEYAVPVSESEYSFYFQKQPGMDWKNFKFIFEGNNKILKSVPEFSMVGNRYILEKEIKEDLRFDLKFDN